MTYVDGFVLAVPKQKLDEYKAMSRRAGDVWKEHGAIDYVESIADDVPYGELTSFPRAVQAFRPPHRRLPYRSVPGPELLFCPHLFYGARARG